MFFTHIQTLWSSVGIVGRGLLYEHVQGICMHMYRPRGRKQCAIISNLVPLRNMHITNLRTSQRPFPSLEVDDPSDIDGKKVIGVIFLGW